MKLKDKIKHKSFWISLVSSIILVIQLLGVRVDMAYVNQVVSAVCGVAMVLGLIIDDSKKDKPSNTNTTNENSLPHDEDKVSKKSDITK